MRPIVRIIGKVLRLVGISSQEDSLPKPSAPRTHLHGANKSFTQNPAKYDAIVGVAPAGIDRQNGRL
jgi:hypothetical protein